MLTIIVLLLVLLFIGCLLLVPTFLLFHLWARSQDLEQLKFLSEMLQSQYDFDFDVDDGQPPPPPHAEIPPQSEEDSDDDIPL